MFYYLLGRAPAEGVPKKSHGQSCWNTYHTKETITQLHLKETFKQLFLIVLSHSNVERTFLLNGVSVVWKLFIV